uniref:Formin-binding protein 1 homolog n=1 Tax=Saccoglossus kowalevskii TaxID=10224 RepID=A0ABM0LVN1_SACKO|nr:PREDICTED: formin-binding protein 1 homolog [Saccoglossus kowalevskii]
MSWGIDLWDQFEIAEKHTANGIDFVDKYCKFVKERCRIENEYATALRRLVKSCALKKKEEESNYSYLKGYADVLKELTDMSGQHESVAESLSEKVVKASEELIRELKADRKKFLKEGHKVKATLAVSIQTLEQAKKNYESSYKSAVNATQQYEKVKDDMNLPRVQVEKQRNLMNQKKQTCEDCKNEYVLQLENTNQAQRKHYNVEMPNVFKQLQELNNHRIDMLGEFYKIYADEHRTILPIIGKCLDGMTAAGNSVDHTRDTNMMIDRYKSGLDPPGDFPFEDISKNNDGDNISTGSGNTPAGYKSGSLTLSGTGRRKGKNRAGIFHIFQKDEKPEDYSDLPPNQRRKKLQQKVDEDALNKMKEVYTKTPALGDPNSVDAQLAENGKKLDIVRTELQKYQMYLGDVDGKTSTPQGTPKQNRLSNMETNANSSSLTSPASTIASTASPRSSITSSHYATSTAPTSPDTGIADVSVNTSTSSYPPGEFDSDDDTSGTYTQQTAALDPVICRCKALYAFEAQSEGAIPMEENEILDVIEKDGGDGWTKIRKGGVEEGYVPTSYIECF